MSRINLQQLHKGFTLIELLVVISLITFLLSVILPQLSTLQQKGRDSARISTAKQIKNAMDIYWPNNFKYPLPPGGNPCIWISELPEIDEIMGGQIKDPLWGKENFKYCTPVDTSHALYANAYGILVRLEEEERYSDTPTHRSGEVNRNGYCKTGIKILELDSPPPGIWNIPDFVPECNF